MTKVSSKNKNKGNTREFGADIRKVLKLVIHSLYTNQDIFIRELISNASDALDKLRYFAIENPSLTGNDTELEIQVSFNKNDSQIIIKDNGIGMNEEDLINNLSNIAHSGTEEFSQALSENPNNGMNLIGQFGVGFYSVFMVAEEVTVISKKAGGSKAFIWNSKGEGEYSIDEYTQEISRGTSIIIKLKPQAIEFAEKFRLRHVITTYSDHISFPIKLIDTQENKSEIVNTGSAIWTRPKSEISEEQYNEFYHHIAHLPDTPLLRIHNKVEGNVEYTSLLYIPSMKPFDLFHPDRKTRVKLYVKRVFITDENVKLIPQYMRFLRGIIDSEDLPLNVSRETLQHNTVLEKIKKSIVKKVLSELKTRAQNDKKEYKNFWNNFGEVMKEGLCEGALEEKDQLLEICRFYSTKSGDDLIGLDEYIERMIDGQDEIFYITGDNIESLRNHPILDGFINRDIEVLLLPDHVDDFWINVINQYRNKELKNVSAADIDLNKIKSLQKNDNDNDGDEDNNTNNDSLNNQNKLVVEFIKKTLGEKIKEVKISSKLIDSPACLALPTGYMSSRMEKLLIEQKQLKAAAAKILEINLKHPILKKITKDVSSNAIDNYTKDLVYLIFDQACILEGEKVDDPKAFAARINGFINTAINN